MALVYVSMNCFIVFLGVALIQAQDQSGFISIDCGAPANINYNEPKTGINYISDANFVNSGVSSTIMPEIISRGVQRQMTNVRSFPEGQRNCYKINITRGSTYLIRPCFLYGNYDGLNKAPQFDILIGANRWVTMNITDAFTFKVKEIIHVPSQDYIQICLVNTGHGTPFISAIELRTLKNDTYVTQIGSLENYRRWDIGSNKSYRYSDDIYDRFWLYGDQNDWKQISASISADSFDQNDYNTPIIVLSTAVTPVNASAPLVISWEPEDPTDKFYVYMHFSEIEVLAENQTREFNIIENGKPSYHKLSPPFKNVNTIFSRLGISGKKIIYSLEKTENSTLPPIINAIEIYRVINFQQSDTHQGDVDAITTIKSVYGVTRNWQGDPCGPVAYLWDGLNCTYRGNEFPRITTLNLSSSELSGMIDPSITNLIMLEKLDLSNNNLNGEVPDFLSSLHNLKIINLENNNLTGSIPSALVKKSKEGFLLLSVGQNPYLCQPGQCNEKKKEKKNIVTPLVASVGGILILLMAVAAILCILKKRKPKALTVKKDQNEMSPQWTEQDDSLHQFKKQIYSYSEVHRITNYFNTIVGRGGFGTVYLGYIETTPVAVKMLSTSSVQGYQQFQAEVKLLMRVHHTNLTSLVGYCNEGDNKALIYEYMANGNLHEHLYAKHSKSKFLRWEDRLRIAVEAALGLEYLHTGCKPPIIHRDVKSTNILLDEKFQAKLSDFGLSKFIPTDGGTHVSTVVAGTPGYLDPDYCMSNRLTQKSDVYSFGIVLLELITGQPVIARNEEMSQTHIIQWVRSLITTGDIEGIVDSRLEGDFDINSAWKAVEIAMACVSLNHSERPTMRVIVTELKETLATEFARNKDSGANPRNSVEIVTMTLDTEVTPLAR